MKSGKDMVIQAMHGGKPEQIPIFISRFWDYACRSIGKNPLKWALGNRESRVDIEVKAARRHAGAYVHRTSGLSTDQADINKDIPDNFPDPGPPPWTDYIEKHLPELVTFSESEDEIIQEEKDIGKVFKKSQCNVEYAKRIVEELGDDYLIASNGIALFPHARRYLGGIEKAMFALMDNPKLVESIMDHIVIDFIETLPVLTSSGTDAVWCGLYNEGAEIINPIMWKKLIYPRHETIVRNCHENGLKAICWFLGDCMPLIEDLARAGFDMVILEQPRIGYKVDVGRMRKMVGNDLCISGWVPELAMINDDREIIEKCIYEQINAAGKDGAFVYSTSIMDSWVNPETVDFFCGKVKEYSN